MGRVQWKEADELTTTSNFHGYTGRHQKMRDRYCFLDVGEHLRAEREEKLS
jgi:hypothetical protein